MKRFLCLVVLFIMVISSSAYSANMCKDQYYKDVEVTWNPDGRTYDIYCAEPDKKITLLDYIGRSSSGKFTVRELVNGKKYNVYMKDIKSQHMWYIQVDLSAPKQPTNPEIKFVE